MSAEGSLEYVHRRGITSIVWSTVSSIGPVQGVLHFVNSTVSNVKSSIQTAAESNIEQGLRVVCGFS
jgi:hypothetical protein